MRILTAYEERENAEEEEEADGAVMAASAFAAALAFSGVAPILMSIPPFSRSVLCVFCFYRQILKKT